VERWVIVGCGYVGMALGRRLAAEGRCEYLVVTRRTIEDAGACAHELGAFGFKLDLGSDRASFAFPEKSLVQRPGEHTYVVCCAPPGARPDYEIESLVRLTPMRRLIYVSSTGVYAPGNGAWVDETWPLEPTTASGRARLAAEGALPPSAVILRAAGIWGPGRGLVDRLRAGTYRIVGDGRARVSRIHVDDLVEAIIRAAASDVTGAINIADDDPAPIGEVADTLAAQLGVAAPPRVPVDSVDAEVAGMLTADRRIANARMKRELGVALRYPSWRSARQ
jgi:nucleoside-diphosphate-sugar epimerase